MILPFSNLATENKIILFSFSPHCIYLIYLLDFGVFRFFKDYYNYIIDKDVWLNDVNFGKLEF